MKLMTWKIPSKISREFAWKKNAGACVVSRIGMGGSGSAISLGNDYLRFHVSFRECIVFLEGGHQCMLCTQASSGFSGYESNVVRIPNEDVGAVPQT